ncbi:kinase-like protein [Xylaria nigripes]|nr:kinase-like protein [Xylaria nigripes]
MSTHMPDTPSNGHSTAKVRYVPLPYESTHSESSARQLILALRPGWSSPDSNIEFVRFTDGITNTLLKAINRKAGLSKEQIDNEAILLRAYGHGTDVIIDRHRETQNHELLMMHGLAPALLARFENGMMYRYIHGKACQPADLCKPSIYLAVARRIAQWHATVPCIHKISMEQNTTINSSHDSSLELIAPGKPVPNVWTVMQKWIKALPTKTANQRARQIELQKDLSWLIKKLSQRPGLGKNGAPPSSRLCASPLMINAEYRDYMQLVFAHCDLLSGNVIIEPNRPETNGGGDRGGENGRREQQQLSVNFIDFEYATPSPAAFDLANHFAEWGGFGCDYIDRSGCRGEIDEELEVQKLLVEVDMYRAVPGFYWGVWALIQATISHIDFDYAEYAEVRLGEYAAWRGEIDGTREAAGREMPLREKRWAQSE